MRNREVKYPRQDHFNQRGTQGEKTFKEGEDTRNIDGKKKKKVPMSTDLHACVVDWPDPQTDPPARPNPLLALVEIVFVLARA